MISARARATLKGFEGYSATAYQDVAGVWTIGWGHTPAVPGLTITEAEAEALLDTDLEAAEAAVRRLVNVPLKTGQSDALMSFVFNLGARRLQSSTLLAKLNDGDYPGAAAEFARWVHAGGRVLPGLEKRRAIEAGWFREGIAAPSADPATQPPSKIAPAPPAPEPPMPIPAMIPIALQALSTLVPAIAGIVGDKTKPIPERNIAAAVKLVDVAKAAIGAANEQEMVERIQADPQAAQAVKQAVQGAYFELVEAGGGGIDGARKADAGMASGAGDLLHSASFWITLALLPIVYMIVGNLIGLFGSASWDPAAKAALVGSLAGSIVGGIVGYYYGQTTSRNRTPPPGAAT